MTSFYKFILAGSLNTLFGFTVSLLFLSILPFKFYISMALATILGVIFNFISFKKFVFNTESTYRAFGKFIAAYLLIYFINIALMSILMDDGVGKTSAFILSFPIIVIITYLLNKQYVFKH